jgi:hypothetical protein
MQAMQNRQAGWISQADRVEQAFRQEGCEKQAVRQEGQSSLER